ncbi:unnamed protein product [Acanthosepion pharaonis]|uniref:Uncharacterized protein n=1 Tax=Acanthosepion pharaonis TaxID=158019 RepID=A0A812CAS0_ACAPH|nr:unnamed protein product [Sepia pharaonis]
MEYLILHLSFVFSSYSFVSTNSNNLFSLSPLSLSSLPFFLKSKLKKNILSFLSLCFFPFLLSFELSLLSLFSIYISPSLFLPFLLFPNPNPPHSQCSFSLFSPLSLRLSPLKIFLFSLFLSLLSLSGKSHALPSPSLRLSLSSFLPLVFVLVRSLPFSDSLSLSLSLSRLQILFSREIFFLFSLYLFLSHALPSPSIRLSLFFLPSLSGIEVSLVRFLCLSLSLSLSLRLSPLSLFSFPFLSLLSLSKEKDITLPSPSIRNLKKNSKAGSLVN